MKLTLCPKGLPVFLLVYGLMFTYAHAEVEEIYFKDTFTRPNSATLGTPEIGGQWVEMNENLTNYTRDDGETISPAFIELKDSAFSNTYQRTVSSEYLPLRSYAYSDFAPVSLPVTLSFSITPSQYARTHHYVTLANSSDGFVKFVDGAQLDVFYPVNGIGLELRRTNSEYDNSYLVFHVTKNGQINPSGSNFHYLPFQLNPGVTYDVNLNIEEGGLLTATVKNGSTVYSVQETVPGSSLPVPLLDRIVVSDTQAGSPNLAQDSIRFDNMLVSKTAPNSAPSLNAIGNKTTNEGQKLEFQVSATDNDGNALTYSASNLPFGATFINGLFTWTPGYNDAGNYENIEFAVVDDGDPIGLDVELITITVGEVNRAPTITNPGPQEVLENHLVTFSVSASDPDGNSVQLSAQNLPTGSSFNPLSGQFSWTPNLSAEGVYIVSFAAADNGTPSASTSIDVVITVGNDPTPTEQANDLIQDLVNLNLPKNTENSYLAHLKKVEIFIEQGKVDQAINQLDMFITKVQNSNLSSQIKNELISAAQRLISDLTI